MEGVESAWCRALGQWERRAAQWEANDAERQKQLRDAESSCQQWASAGECDKAPDQIGEGCGPARAAGEPSGSPAGSDRSIRRM